MKPSRERIGRAIAGALAAVVILSAPGCLYVPTSQDASPLQGREVKDRDVAFLQPGVTTKEDVAAHFGNPTILWRDENILIYRWVKRKGVVLWAVATGYAASFGAVDVPEELAFLLKFDEHDRFVNSEILTKPASKSYGEFLLEWRDAQRARGWKPKEAKP